MNLTPIQLKNLLAFLTVMQNEGQGIMPLSPDYIEEKFIRYVGYPFMKDSEEAEWGIHPLLKEAVLDRYLKDWGIE